MTVAKNTFDRRSFIKSNVLAGGGLTFNEGVCEQDNLDSYEMIRFGDTPKSIDVHFVNNEINPTGLGEPPPPPIMGALANALYRATGKRHYHQPYMNGA